MATSKTPRKKAASKRELIAPKGDKRYVRRDAKGRIKESDDVSRSLSADRSRKAKTTVKKGQGDEGDAPAKKGAGKKAAVKKPAGKTPAPKKPAGKKPVFKMPAAKKPAGKKAPAKKSGGKK